jgi:hypothetical protein
VLVIDVVVEVVLDCHVRTGKAVISLYNLYVECLCTPCKDARKHCVELLFLYVHLPADAKEDFDLVIEQIVGVPCVLVAIVLELRELRNCVGTELVIA